VDLIAAPGSCAPKGVGACPGAGGNATPGINLDEEEGE